MVIFLCLLIQCPFFCALDVLLMARYFKREERAESNSEEAVPVESHGSHASGSGAWDADDMADMELGKAIGNPKRKHLPSGYLT